jgi:hypothetical protein
LEIPVPGCKKRLIDLGWQLASEYTDKKKLQAAYSKWYREHKSEIWPFQDYKFIDAGGIYTGSRCVHNPGTEGYRSKVQRINRLGAPFARRVLVELRGGVPAAFEPMTSDEYQVMGS